MNKLTILISLLWTIEIHSQDLKGEAEVAKELIRQWVQTEKKLSKEQENWKQEKAHLTDLMSLYKKELKLLNEELLTITSIEGEDEKKQDLKNGIVINDLERRDLRVFLLKFKKRFLILTKRFPKPLQEQVSETISALKAVKKDISARDLLMPMLSLVEAGNSFNAGVYRTSQKIIIDGQEWQVEVMYLGLGRAYFFVGEKAGIGSPAANGNGWVWRRDDVQLLNIKKAMAVFDKKAQPELIKLPLKVK